MPRTNVKNIAGIQHFVYDVGVPFFTSLYEIVCEKNQVLFYAFDFSRKQGCLARYFALRGRI